ncbi:hypothetical protein CEXT_108851 [Caerostris extrusa]|uniref:Uncharacterized protein n=1 Tax=Caerostris extrusa TaxID=172846 RepID=A0AAV4R4S9_CAEEX|nr:hypothetical protein CEXT_108851 [Caerostris extrusa]
MQTKNDKYIYTRLPSQLKFLNPWCKPQITPHPFPAHHPCSISIPVPRGVLCNNAFIVHGRRKPELEANNQRVMLFLFLLGTSPANPLGHPTWNSSLQI